MNFLPGWFPAPRTLVVPVEIEYLGATTWSHPGGPQTVTVHSWNGAPFGTPSEDRIIGVVLAVRTFADTANTLITSLTIGGSSAEFGAQIEMVNNDSLFPRRGRLAFAYRLVPAGTSGSIVTNFSREIVLVIAHVFSIKKSSGVPIGVTAGLAQNLSLSQNIAAGAGMIAAAANSSTTSISPATTISGLVDTRVNTVSQSEFANRLQLRSANEDNLKKASPLAVSASVSLFNSEVCHQGLSVQFVPA